MSHQAIAIADAMVFCSKFPSHRGTDVYTFATDTGESVNSTSKLVQFSKKPSSPILKLAICMLIMATLSSFLKLTIARI